MAFPSLWRMSVALAFQLHISHALFAGHTARTSDTPQLSQYMLNRLIVIPEHKLLFCYIEKVACSNFNELFRTVRSRYDASQLVGHQWYKNTPQVHGLSLTDLKGILVNQSWHKAVFYREPVERFVSAFASKCEHADRDGSRHCARQFGSPDISFEDAVLQIQEGDRNGTNQRRFNPHFIIQSDFCGGLSHTLKYYDTVEELDRSTANAKVSTLLSTVGIEPSSVPELETLFPKPDDNSWQQSAHNTAANDDLNRYFPAGAEWRVSPLRHHYAEDYKLFYHENPETQFLKIQGNAPAMSRWPLQ